MLTVLELATMLTRICMIDACTKSQIVTGQMRVNMLFRGEHMKLNLRAFAVTCGLVWGIGLFCLTWWIMLFEGATRERTCIGRLYRGYNISPLGSVIGLIWGFFDALYRRSVICLDV